MTMYANEILTKLAIKPRPVSGSRRLFKRYRTETLFSGYGSEYDSYWRVILTLNWSTGTAKLHNIASISGSVIYDDLIREYQKALAEARRMYDNLKDETDEKS